MVNTVDESTSRMWTMHHDIHAKLREMIQSTEDPAKHALCNTIRAVRSLFLGAQGAQMARQYRYDAICNFHNSFHQQVSDTHFATAMMLCEYSVGFRAAMEGDTLLITSCRLSTMWTKTGRSTSMAQKESCRQCHKARREACCLRPYLGGSCVTGSSHISLIHDEMIPRILIFYLV